MSRFDPSEAEWRSIEPLLPGADGRRMGARGWTIGGC